MSDLFRELDRRARSARVPFEGGFVMEHTPIPKPRHRSQIILPKGTILPRGRDGKPQRPFVHFHPDGDGERDEKRIAEWAIAFAPPAPIEGPLKLRVVAALLVPASWPDWERRAALAGRILPTSVRNAGDVDNFAKQLMDALTRSGRWWKDDAQVVELRARKVYAEVAGWAVRVEEIVEPSREEWLEEERASARRASIQTDMFGEAR